MSDFTRINAPRVGKILETLAIIDKSARSNGATPEDVAALLAPIGWRFATPQTSAPAPGQRSDIAIADAAREAPLRDLVRAMAVLLNRIDEEILG